VILNCGRIKASTLTASETMTESEYGELTQSTAPETVVKLSLVVPVFNESETVALFIDSVSGVFAAEPLIDLEILFINDGSTDDTLSRLLKLQSVDSRIHIVDLSRNFGKEAALTAGMQLCSGQIIVPIDVDLQDPPQLIPAMVAKWREGFEVVLGRRTDRNSDS